VKVTTVMKRETEFTLAMLCTLLMVAMQPAQAQTFKVLHNFGGPGDGWAPFAQLVADDSGQLYVVTLYGAAGSS
jgi:hypothetical protein